MARSHHSKEEEEESGSENDPEQRQNLAPHKLFEDEYGRPIKFYFHKSINLPGARRALTSDIEKHGGKVLDSDKGVHTVLVNPRRLSVDIEIIRDRYNVDEDPKQRDIYVEALNFIQNCIRNKRYTHALRPRQGIGGATGTRTRVPFTQDDDDHLCHYLALKVSEKDRGGRAGNELYKTLIKMYDRHDPEKFAWVRRHTWHSWRERYVKNMQRFDDMIADKVPIVKPTDKHAYYRDRRLGRAGRGRREEEEEEESLGPSDSEISHRGDDEYDELGNPEDNDDMLDEEDLKTHQGKRKGSETHKGSLPGESLAKRQRTHEDSSGIRRVSNVGQGHSSRPSKGASNEMKGKRRAEPYIVVDNEAHRPSSLFSLDFDDLNEPGPSGARRSSPSPPPRRSPHYPLAPTQPQSSQMTLVDPATTQAQHRRLARKSQSMSLPSGRADASGSLSTHVPSIEVERNEIAQPTSQGHGGPPRVRTTRQPAAAAVPAVVQSSAVHQTSSREPSKRAPVDAAPAVDKSAPMPQAFSAAAVKSKPVMKKTASKPKSKPKAPPAAAHVEAPYRNTRSKSRSVEPSGFTTTQRKAKGKAKKISEKQRENLEPLDEGGSDEDEVIVEMVNPDVPVGETLAEEQDVEDLLIADGNDQSEITHREDEDLEVEVPRQARDLQRKRSRENSLDMDDEQTHNSLRESARHPPISSLFDVELDPTELMRTLKTHKLSKPSDKRQSWNTSRPIYREPPHAGTSAKPNPVTSPQPRTPGPSRPSRTAPTNSQSSGESIPFPISGTRASAMKMKLEQEEKRTPYKPPVGTRAARRAVPK